VIDVLWKQESFAAASPPESRSAAELAQVRLVAAFRDGDAAAFEALYRQLVRGIYALTLRLTSRVAEAEELTQEVFVRAWEARATFASPGHLQNWLRRVSVNVWINRLRRQRHVTLDDEAVVAAHAAALSSPAGAPGVRLDLERALALLSPRLRAVVLLFDLYGLDHGEIAELMGMTPGASKVQLHRARRRLRELMP
jgi:RNA polymerase sigma-70 factor, ECF subfamily